MLKPPATPEQKAARLFHGTRAKNSSKTIKKHVVVDAASKPSRYLGQNIAIDHGGLFFSIQVLWSKWRCVGLLVPTLAIVVSHMASTFPFFKGPSHLKLIVAIN